MEKIFGFCFFVALAGCVATPAFKEDGLKKAMTPIPFVARLALSADAAEARYQVRSLLPKDEGCDAHNLTEWDVHTVAGADVYFSIGLPFEAELVNAARRRNPELRVVPLDQKCWRTEGNPYVWMSGLNRGIMDAAAKKFFDCKKFCICGSPCAPLPVAESIKRAKLENYTVAILHPAFAYECGQYGVKTVSFDEKSFRYEFAADPDDDVDPDDGEEAACEGKAVEGEPVTADHGRLRQIAAAEEIKTNDVSLILALPSQRWIGDALANLSQAKVAYVDLFGGDSPLDVDTNLIEDISTHEEMKAQREALAEEERELAALSPAERRLEGVQIPQIAFYAPATMKEAAEFLTQASEDFGPPELPKEKRRITFTCAEDAARRVAPPRPDQPGISIIPIGPMTNWMSLRAALQFVCEQTGCVYEAGDGTVRIILPTP